MQIFAVNNLAPVGQQSDALIRFDSANPAGWTTVGSLGVPGAGFGGLDFAGIGGNLYGYVSFASGTPAVTSGLYRINTTTGAATLIGNSGQSLQDLSWDPVANQMLGINSVGNIASLYSINLSNGATTSLGTFSGLPATNLEVGLAVDASGNRYVHDVASDRIFKGAGLNLTQSILLSRDTNFSQGMVIDWAGSNQGYHGAIGNAPAFFSRLFTFDTNLTAWTDLGTFGVPDGTFPTVETGDLAIIASGGPRNLIWNPRGHSGTLTRET